VPAWKGARISGPAAFASGAFCSLAALSAYSVIPSASILALSGIWAAIRDGRSRQAAIFVAGSMIAGLGILTWLVIFGDLLGYLAFHIAANQFVYAKYINFTFGSFLRALLPRLRPDAVVHALGLLCCAWSFTVLLLKTGESDSAPRGPSCGPAHLHWLPVALGLIGVLLLNARGTMWFQDGTFLVTAIGWAAVSTPAVLLRLGSRSPAVLSCGPVLAIVAVVATVELTMRSYAVASPSGLTYRQLEQLPASELGLLDTPMFRRVRAIVSPNERVLALVYDPGFYLAAGRLPIDKYYQYLPWDADYAKAPWFGRDHDLCADLARSPPPLIYFDDWKVWNTFAPEDYMPCVLDILARTYDRSAEFPKLYIRKDRVRTTR
ncbi:MAG: hypothetical protein JO047_15420, partial [Alphaproteobacteria bacterium]|nr:hypothetical protein [Alphaproteobacteria bacterium]